MNRMNGHCSRRRNDSALKLAVRLAVRQLSDGVGIDEAIQFAAKYHNITCAAIAAELSKRRAYGSPIPPMRIIPIHSSPGTMDFGEGASVQSGPVSAGFDLGYTLRSKGD
jgi:hypothetical protein